MDRARCATGPLPALVTSAIAHMLRKNDCKIKIGPWAPFMPFPLMLALALGSFKLQVVLAKPPLYPFLDPSLSTSERTADITVRHPCLHNMITIRHLN